jgi:hypothetical protein
LPVFENALGGGEAGKIALTELLLSPAEMGHLSFDVWALAV